MSVKNIAANLFIHKNLNIFCILRTLCISMSKPGVFLVRLRPILGQYSLWDHFCGGIWPLKYHDFF